MQIVLLTLSMTISGCTFNLFSSFQDNPCREKEAKAFPITTLMQSYSGSALGKLIPISVRPVPASALYSLLEDGNQNDASTWRIKGNSDYSGYFEVFPVKKEGVAFCRKFIQKMKVNDLNVKAHGKSCKPPQGVWVIVEEIQFYSALQ